MEQLNSFIKWGTDNWLFIAAILGWMYGVLSDAIAAHPGIKANGVVQLIYSIIGNALGKKSKVEEVKEDGNS